MEKSQPDDGPVPTTEWDFSKVIDDEVIACCLWEYARESRSFRFTARIQRAIYVDPKAFLHDEAESAEAYRNAGEAHDEEIRRAKEQGFDYEEFLDRFWKSDLGFSRIYDELRGSGGPKFCSWQDQPESVRTRLSSHLRDTGIFQPLAAVNVGELEQLWITNSQELVDIRDQPENHYDDSEDLHLLDPTEPVEPPEEEDRPSRKKAVAFTVDFSRFTDTEIVSQFEAWLREHRPHRWQTPERVLPGFLSRGRKLNDYRVALDRLGLMRLLHWYSPEALKEEVPEAWARYGHKQDSFRREVREAIKFFRKQFPFLPPDELPESAERLGIWLSRMNKLADEVANEMEGEGDNKSNPI